MNKTIETGERSLGQRIAEFPLVALVAAVVFYLAAASFGLWIGSFVRLGVPANSIVRSVITTTITLAMYKFLIARLGKHPCDELRGDQALSGLGKGMLAGALLFSAIVAIAALLGVYRVVGTGSRPEFVVSLVTSAMMPAVMEELLFRGILLRWIEEFAGSWIALLVTSALFGLAHIYNPGATWFSSLTIAVAGLMLGAAYMLARSLWMPIGLHAAWNLTQGAVFGVPVSGLPSSGLLRAKLSGPLILSGGSFGLEASIMATVVCTAAASWFIWKVVACSRLIRPCWMRPKARETNMDRRRR